MRPIKLIIEGVNSFIEAQELDFEAAGRSNLFCICGRTGAGKSTVFDSIMLALYGKTSRGFLPDIVNLSRTSAFVSFEFAEGGERYKVERTVKIKYAKDAGGNPTDRRVLSGTDCVLYRNGEPVANTAEDVAALVDEVIGLDAGEFKNVYMLEQGEYAEFLKKTPAKQTEAVGKIFSLMRFGDVYKLAGEKRAEEEKAAEQIDLRIRDLGEVSAELVRAANTELNGLRASLASLVKDIDARRAEIETLSVKRDEYLSAQEKSKAVKMQAVRLDEAKSRLGQAERKLDEFTASCTDDDTAALKDLIARREQLSKLNALDKEYESVVKTARQKKEELENAKAAESRAVAAVETAKSCVDGVYAKIDGALNDFSAAAGRLEQRSAGVSTALDAFAVADRDARIRAIDTCIFDLKDEKKEYDALAAERTETLKNIDERKKSAADILKKIESYAAELTAAEEKKAEAEKARAAAAEALDRARLNSHAAAVRAELNAGDVCPVCGNVYGGGGACCDTDELDAARQAADRTAAAEKAAEAACAELSKKKDAASAEYGRADSDLHDLTEKLGRLEEKILSTRVEPEIYAELAAAIGKAKKLAIEYAAASAELNESAPARAAAEAHRLAAEKAAEEADARARELAEKLGDDCGKTTEELAEVDKQKSQLEQKIAERDKRRAELEKEKTEAAAAVKTLEAGLNEAVKACPVDMPEFDEEKFDGIKSMYDAAVARRAENENRIGVKSAELEKLNESLKKKKAFEAERAECIRRADLYATIATMTKGKAMLNYVVAEYIEQFTAIASDILSELSHGKYTMCYSADDGFVVSDFLNGGKPRKTDTLSGGELFLASLSVAIAIARAVGKGNNAFFFLDEGFGTLDDELIDSVYGALETLSRDCLVGVISHAEALIDRCPSRVEIIEATDTCGSRIEY